MPGWRTFLRRQAVQAGTAGTARAALPARLQDLLRAQETRSERLIGWVQLAIVASFGLLYAIAPRPEDAPDRMLRDPVLIVLLMYGTFTVGRLVLAYKWRLPSPLLILSILADIGLLIALIWAFHERYGQTPPFSLKAPTFVYMFVFIALRTLRFDHRYVLVAGIAAAIGWLGLVAVVLKTAGSEVITRSFVAYLNSNRVLLGAEFDKVFALLLATAVLAFAVSRGRALVVAAIRDEAALRDLSRFFGQGISDTVVLAGDELVAGAAQERDAAIMMLDIRGFTGIASRVSPRNVVELLTGLHAHIIPIVREHGGIVDKFLGDGIMITFGAVTPSKTAAADALRALDEIMAVAAMWEAEAPNHGLPRPLEVNGAVVSGPVVFAVLGAGDRLEYTVIGTPVNLAAKLEKHNKIEGTRALTTFGTYRRAVHQGYTRQRPGEQRPARSVADQAAIDLVVMAGGTSHLRGVGGTVTARFTE
jgi:adenylate cyclase